MPNKWKIFGYQTNLEWYDVKTKFKQLSRKITYSWLFQEMLSWIFFFYMHLVYKTSRVKFVNEEILFNAAKNNEPILICFWHNRLMMAPFIVRKARKKYPSYRVMTLASRHGDGRTVGRVMEKFGFISILGSTKGKQKKASRGIELHSLREIMRGLKKGYSLGITPDGPRGPNQEISGDLIHLAQLSGAGILPCSATVSNAIEFNSWDRFKFPLPFSKICFVFDKETIAIDKKAEKKEMEKFKKLAKKRMDFVQDKSQELL